MQTPIIIYDRNTRQALRTKTGDLPAFYQAWKREYDKHRQQIQAACSAHSELSQYCIDPKFTAKDVASIANTEWFQERVFDSFLWHAGA